MQCHSARRARATLHARRRELRLLSAARASRWPTTNSTMPVTEAQVRALRIGDTVTLQRTLFGIRDAHADPHVRPRPAHALRPARPRRDPHRAQRAQGGAESPSIPAGYAPVCIGTTTSDAHGALHAAADGAVTACASSSARAGCARTRCAAFARAGRRLPRDRRRHRGAGDDLDRARSRTSTSTTSTPSRCGSSASRDFGPLLVAMDSHGGSLYARGRRRRRRRARAALASLACGLRHVAGRADAARRRPTS
ncbi:MAG: hypothetical protein MZW92_41020 [Comamonadaceae bacterium]|nr:hypothetical protein [Comamonadaceae bacterium]